jgi:acetylornithine deacetylase/succinyl-diaminopimelate desuccinylase-like protein
VFEKEGIPVTIAAKDPARANVIARLRGNGSKRPILLMGHEDTVQVDPAKWTFPPFSATRDGGYVYARGAIDNKWQVAANIMTMLMLKRGNVALDRDVIFVAEAGEEASTGPGIQYLVDEHWPEIDAEACVAEGGTVRREGGQVRFALTQTAEKIPAGAKLVVHRPIRPRLAPHAHQRHSASFAGHREGRAVGSAHALQRHHPRLLREDGHALPARPGRAIQRPLRPAKAPAVREYLAENDPSNYSMLHTSISPNIITGGFQVNVIPSTAEATLDIRALPDENMPGFYDLMRKVINDPAVQVVPNNRNARPARRPRASTPTSITPLNRPIARCTTCRPFRK